MDVLGTEVRGVSRRRHMNCTEESLSSVNRKVVS